MSDMNSSDSENREDSHDAQEEGSFSFREGMQGKRIDKQIKVNTAVAKRNLQIKIDTTEEDNSHFEGVPLEATRVHHDEDEEDDVDD